MRSVSVPRGFRAGGPQVAGAARDGRLGVLSKLGYDAARSVPFYEAWLATLAILVWHGYYVMLNPDTYPMNMSWLNGMLSRREMEEEHPLELQRIESENREASAQEASPNTESTAREDGVAKKKKEETEE